MANMLGEIRAFGGNYAPKGWKFCKGEKMRIQGNEALYSVLGSQYGGDGRTSFALPNLNTVPCLKGSPIYIINVGEKAPPQRS